ncbi:Predicted transcriptional regulator YheO, contains PAS and DNA-binding HTH domains [Duganella sp. CF402]|uniref:helix-turn-helix transcriptional regulator n=1 Tax=unclassified Duganella TaxID=2636909 RepID=UPI0008C73C30|nr:MULTISPECIES: PAS domain-containing protein [unclassified Duganella]RZT10333.1 putative transcriptional regulator YheO [Duganella sp. BK701]SEL17982.1 Predicted transcriptional regulator YheO, contains PAS and DNA-binding HTH domains [Duganella sp. CF402]
MKKVSVAGEREAVINALRPVVPMLAAMAGPHLEVVLHDVSKPENSVIAIANGHISGRSVGSSVLEGPQNDRGFAAATRIKSPDGAVHSIVEDYVTVTADGRELRSASAIFRDASGEPFATLCLNVDLSGFKAAHGWLSQMLKPMVSAMVPATPDAPVAPAESQMDTLMQEIISEAVGPGGSAETMKREEKIQAVGAMQRRGLFIVKGGVERAAAALGVSRFTVYNYMEQLRRREQD